MVFRCGNDILKNILLKYSNKNTNTKALTDSSVIIKNIPKNPYLSSITGKYAFDLSEISNFSVYFWKSDDNQTIQNQAIQETLKEEKTTTVDWSETYQEHSIDSVNQFTSFINKTCSITKDYSESDIVFVLLADFGTTLGACYGPETLKDNPDFVNNKIIIFMNNKVMNNENMKKGGTQYLTLIHEVGHAFGLSHPHGADSGSTIIPGINENPNDPNDKVSSREYPSFSAYGQNTVFNTVMSYDDTLFFLSEEINYSNDTSGYPQTLTPLDLLAMRWLYDIVGTSAKYITNYGISVINPLPTENRCETIVGTNRTITFGQNCKNISFYFSNQLFRTNNIEPIDYEYNRILEKQWGFYPRDLDSTVSVLNFNNTEISNVFIENNGLKVNLTINLQKNKVFNMYITDLSTNYTFLNGKYTNKKTKLFIQINNRAKSSVNVFFN
jgi:hypothetical protein